MRKLKMLSNWDILSAKKGTMEGMIVDILSEVLDDSGFIDYWVVPFEGEYYQVYPYEAEETDG